MTGLSACLLTGLPAGLAGLHGSQPPQGGLSASEAADSRLSQSAALGRAKYHVLSIRDSLPIFGQK